MDRMAQKIFPFIRIIFEPSPRSAATFASVAVCAGCHEISGRVVAALHKRLNVVNRQFVGGAYSSAIRAAIGIAVEDVCAPVVSRF